MTKNDPLEIEGLVALDEEEARRTNGGTTLPVRELFGSGIDLCTKIFEITQD